MTESLKTQKLIYELDLMQVEAKILNICLTCPLWCRLRGILRRIRTRSYECLQKTLIFLKFGLTPTICKHFQKIEQNCSNNNIY